MNHNLKKIKYIVLLTYDSVEKRQETECEEKTIYLGQVERFKNEKLRTVLIIDF